MRSLILRVAVVAVVLGWCAAKVPAPLDDAVLVQVQVMHRHGAREAICQDNQTWVCAGAAYKCGELNSEGRDMLTNLGEWLASAYSEWLGLTPQYSQYQTFTRSTDLDRTIQSADSLLRGMFPDVSTYYPIVNTVTFATDLLMLVDAQMSYTIPFLQDKAPGFKLAESFYATIPAADLVQMGTETRQFDTCVKEKFTNKEYLLCVLRLQDIAASWNAEGRLQEGSKLATYWNNLLLDDARRTFNSQLYLYDPSNEDMKARGSLGYGLASTIIETMNSAVANIAKPDPTKAPINFFDWSAHDTTYMPLASAIGLNTSDFMLPQFGQAFIFELWRKPDESYHVMVKGGAPPQPNGTHAYVITTYPLTGLDVNNHTVFGDILPLDQWVRGVNATAPTSPKGSCYLSKSILSDIDCNTIKAPTHPNCTLYRQRCPKFACAENYVVNPVDLSCVSINQHELMSTAAAVLMVASTAAAGVLLGGAIVQMINIVFNKRSQGAYAEVQETE